MLTVAKHQPLIAEEYIGLSRLRALEKSRTGFCSPEIAVGDANSTSKTKPHNLIREADFLLFGKGILKVKMIYM